MKCALVVGHKPKSPGAINKASGMTEYEFNNGLAKDIKKNITCVDIKIIQRESYVALPSKVNLHSPDFVVSMHCNAFNKKVDGSEVLYYHTSEKGKEIATIFQYAFVGRLGLANRGIKPRTSEDRGGYLLRYTNAPCIIAEPFFIDNNNELSYIHTMYKHLISAYVASIEETAEYLSK